MKHSLVLSLCAVAVAACMSGVALADTDVALNLRYTHPADVSQGGSWQLVAKTGDANGIAGISAYLSNLDNTVAFDASTAFYGGVWDGNGAVADVTEFSTFSGTVGNVAFGFNLDGTDTSGMGTGSGNGNQAQDPLDQQNNGLGTWNNVAVIATGAFSGARPAFVDGLPGALDTTAANDHTAASIAGTGGAALATIGLKTVRGDSLVSLGLEAPGGAGLLQGDGNRDGKISFFSDLFGPFNNISPDTGQGWSDGDFNGNGVVSFFSDLFAPFNNIGGEGTPPAISAVPEPGSVVLMLLGTTGLLGLRRRRKE